MNTRFVSVSCESPRKCVEDVTADNQCGRREQEHDEWLGHARVRQQDRSRKHRAADCLDGARGCGETAEQRVGEPTRRPQAVHRLLRVRQRGDGTGGALDPPGGSNTRDFKQDGAAVEEDKEDRDRPRFPHAVAPRALRHAHASTATDSARTTISPPVASGNQPSTKNTPPVPATAMPPTPGFAAPNSPATTISEIIAIAVCQRSPSAGPTGSRLDDTTRLPDSVPLSCVLAVHLTRHTVPSSEGGTGSVTVTFPVALASSRTLLSLPRSTIW